MKEEMSTEELLEALRKVVPAIDQDDTGSLLNTGTLKYYCVLRTHIDNGTCPFCPNGFNPSLNKIIHQNDHWMFWENPVGKNDDALEKHFVFALKGQHLTDVTKLSIDQQLAYMEITLWAIENHKIPGGAIVMRFGQVKRNSGSLRHIHGNIFVPAGHKRYAPTLAKDEAVVRSKAAKVLLWEKQYQAQKRGITDLDSVLTPDELEFLNRKD